jgi:hypothetical protein
MVTGAFIMGFVIFIIILYFVMKGTMPRDK